MKTLYAIVLSSLLASCSMVERTETDKEEKKSISTGEIGADSYVPNGMGFTPPGSGEKLSASKEKELLDLVDQENIAFTDPDNPDAEIKDIDEAFIQKKKISQLWGQSYNTALREARRSGKGVLLWFHDNKISAPSKQLGVELFSTPEFLTWARDNLILLCYDKHAAYKHQEILNEQGLPVSSKTIKIRKDEYVKNMFDQFSVRGAPFVAIVSPDGQRIDSWAGYKTGSSKFVFDKIKNARNLSNEKFIDFKKKLVKQGYKDWRGRNGSSLFAKFTRYDEKKSEVWLREFDGYQSKTKLASLISEDQQWVLDEIQKGKDSKKASL